MEPLEGLLGCFSTVYIDNGDGDVHVLRPEASGSTLSDLVEEIHTTRLSQLYIDGPACANSTCQKPGLLACGGCHLVKYCGKECQKQDWTKHKHHCKKNHLASRTWTPRWNAQARSPTIYGPSARLLDKNGPPPKYLWGNMPAVDILQLQKNEGSSYDKPINICFAASGDLRNVMQTMTSIPDSFKEKCFVAINDNDPDVVIRNAIIMLVIYSFSAKNAAVIVSHLWYSFKLPKVVVTSIQNVIKPLVAPVVAEPSANAVENHDDGKVWEYPWRFHGRTFSVALCKGDWKKFMKILDFGLESDKAEAARRKVYDSIKNIDRNDDFWVGLTPSRRVAEHQFIQDGILTSFATDRSIFKVPNSTLLSDAYVWHDHLGAHPIEGWNVSSVLSSGKAANLPTNDTVGAHLIHVQNLIERFHTAIHTRSFTFQLTCEDAHILPRVHPSISFDRIDLSNLIDFQWGGVGNIHIALAPMLRSKLGNPYATIIGVWMALVSSLCASGKTEAKENEKEMAQRAHETLRTDPGYLARLRLQHCRGDSLFHIVRTFFRNCEDFVDPVLEHYAPFLEKRLGLVAKEKNTIIPEWPCRVKGKGAISMEEVELMCLARTSGQQRVVEWKRI